MSCNNWCNQRNFKKRLYNELDLHSLGTRRCRSKLMFFNKTVDGLLPEYLYSYLNFPFQDNIKSIPSRTESF